MCVVGVSNPDVSFETVTDPLHHASAPEAEICHLDSKDFEQDIGIGPNEPEIRHGSGIKRFVEVQ